MRIKVDIAGIIEARKQVAKDFGKKEGGLEKIITEGADYIYNDIIEMYGQSPQKGKTRSNVWKDGGPFLSRRLTDYFFEDLKPDISYEQSGKNIKKISVGIGAVRDLYGDKYMIQRKWDMKRQLSSLAPGGVFVPRAPGDIGGSQYEDGKRSQYVLEKNQFFQINAPGTDAAGYQFRTKNLLFWTLVEYGVRAHYIYSGKVFGNPDAPYLFRPGEFILRVLHPGYSGTYFFRRAIRKVHNDHYKLLRGIKKFTEQSLKDAMKKAAQKSRKK